MKRGKKPTREQRKAIQARGLNPDNWLVAKQPPGKLVMVHRLTGALREIERE